MTSRYPWLIFITLGLVAAFVLDADGALPFFVVWGLIGVLLAIEADATLKRRKDQDGARTKRGTSRIWPNKANTARHDVNRRRPMEFSRC